MSTPISWPEAQRICDIPEVREALDKFAADAQEENMLAMVSAIMGHAATQGRAAGLEEERPVKWQGRCNNSPWIDLSESDAEYVKDRLGWETRPLYTKPPAVAQPVLAESAPASYVLMPRRLTAENGAKAALSGEFAEKATYHCSQCDHEEPDDGCEECNGKGSYLVDVPIEWDTIKRIYKAAVDLLGKPAALSPTPSVAGKDDARDAARLDWMQRQHLQDLLMMLIQDAPYDGKYYVEGDNNARGYGDTLREAIDAAMSSLEVIGKGEKG